MKLFRGILYSLAILAIILAALQGQSLETSGSVQWGGSVELQSVTTTPTPTNQAKCEAYLIDAGVDPNTFINTGEQYEQVGQGVTCFGPNLTLIYSRDDF